MSNIQMTDWLWYVGQDEHGAGLILQGGEVYIHGGIVNGKNNPGDVKIKINSNLLWGLARTAAQWAARLEAAELDNPDAEPIRKTNKGA